MNPPTPPHIVRWFRDAAPYIHQHRGKTFVVYFSGDAIANGGFDTLIHDLALLHALGIGLVLVHGARPQIESRLALQRIEPHYAEGLRITDAESLDAVIEAVGRVRVSIEAKLTLSLANTPMSGSRIRVASGNFIVARPLGVRNGVDFQHTGEVRRIEVDAIQAQLAARNCVLLSPLGYARTGEVFNLSGEEVATSTAIALRADKLILLNDAHLESGLATELGLHDLPAMLDDERLAAEFKLHLNNSARAIEAGVPRCHIVDAHSDGAMLMELFTREGSGLLISAGGHEGLRRADSGDVDGILALIRPLEEKGALVHRPREQLEGEIQYFTVIERNGEILACAALFPFAEERIGELACLAVHPEFRREGRGDALLERIEADARGLGLTRLFVLSTQTMHWFQERGYLAGELDALPLQRAKLYNFQRRSKIFIKALTA
ncbi:MAG: amino-acid N-acetyltransferase [Thiotrichales bacterium]